MNLFVNLFFHFPGIEKYINFFPPAADHIRNMTKDIMKQRRQRGIVTEDFVSRLMDIDDAVRIKIQLYLYN